MALIHSSKTNIIFEIVAHTEGDGLLFVPSFATGVAYEK
ncbi:hypothetical protein CPS_1002 [Colwellia psychrerythraea 34H]|uniref:Uncharacterized protein n=1 Tax=Colwellia psychrerythraea (strain 34H / ATCC BAA-681) TaxID=167879 RepID=Q487L4_COLP3|nr:hypothetical protein CPS_1002 [Colwellia psychrerythraea 34H]